MSTKVGEAEFPTSSPLNGFPLPVTSLSDPLVFLKNWIVPSDKPIKASESSSPSMSTKVGTIRLSKSCTPLSGLELPVSSLNMPFVFLKNWMRPPPVPINASRSPSSSISAKVGLDTYMSTPSKGFSAPYAFLKKPLSLI